MQTIETIEVPFNKIVLGDNVRKTYSKASIESLAASIQSDGLLQPIKVVRAGKKFETVFGFRRYFAHKHLIDNNLLPPDHPVRCEVIAKLDEADALRIKTMENVQREQMHPVDEAEAFAAMVKAGAELADIAAKTGFSEITVRRRLAIAALCSEAKKALRDGLINLSVAEALTLGTKKQQKQIIELVKSGRGDYDADDVRGHLLEGKPSVSKAIFPIEQYTGTITSDLFADDDNRFFDDEEQFMALQRAAVEALVEQHKATATFVDLIEAYTVPWYTYEKSRAKKAGVVIHFHPAGMVEVRTGLKKVEQVSAKTRAAVEDNPVAPAPRPEYGTPLVRYINSHKTLAVQASLLGDTRRATELAVLLLLGGVTGSMIGIGPHAAFNFFVQNEDAASKAYEVIEDEANRLCRALGLGTRPTAGYYRKQEYPNGWARLLSMKKDPAKAFAAVKQLSDADLQRLHLLLTTMTFGVVAMDKLDGDENSLFNLVARDIGVNMADHWRPDAHFLAKRNRKQLEQIAAEAEIGGFTPQAKKGEIVSIAAARFAAGEKDATRNWLPGAMHFPATGPDVVVARPEDYYGHDDDAAEESDPEPANDDEMEAYSEAAE